MLDDSKRYSSDPFTDNYGTNIPSTISTNGDFVEDSFHLRNNFGFKIKDALFIEKLKKEITQFLS